MDVNRIRRLPPLFWLGLLPVVILLWAWADSLRHMSTWTRFGGRGCTEFALRASMLRMLFTSVAEGAEPPTPLTVRERILFPDDPWGRWRREDHVHYLPLTWFPSASASIRSYAVTTDYMRTDELRVIPLWLILACYLPPWLGLVWWQARRRVRKRRAEEEALRGEAEVC